MPSWTTAAGLAAGYLADQLLGDPRRGHPVAGFGLGAARLEQLCWRDDRRAGALHWVVCVAPLVAAAVGCERVVRGRPLVRVVALGVGTWAVLGGRSLAAEGAAMAELLERAERLEADAQAPPDLAAARQRLSHLCGRDPAGLDADGLARAAVESLAENTSDAVVAPLLWGAVAGLPGLLGYRAVNTLDAMVGHRTPRYARFGWCAARLDDVANLVPARVAALVTAAVAPVVCGRATQALTTWRRDGHHHPSPNAGPVEAAFAGALGVTLGGLNVYDGRTEDRGRLGHGPAPSVADLRRAVRLSRWVGAGALAVSVAVSVVRRDRTDRGRGRDGAGS